MAVRPRKNAETTPERDELKYLSLVPSDVLSEEQIERARSIGRIVKPDEWEWVGEDRLASIKSTWSTRDARPQDCGIKVANSTTEIFVSLHIDQLNITRNYIFPCNFEEVSAMDVLRVIELSNFSQLLPKIINAIWFNKVLRKEDITVAAASVIRTLRGKTWENLEPDKTRIKRKYRKASERPHPELAADAEANRTKQQIKLRLDPTLIERVTEQAEAQGKTRQQWIEDVLAASLDLQ
ncbi:hypothetical protein MJD09_05095 [bacterium]|nr:hypothetical protein [bacterium]